NISSKIGLDEKEILLWNKNKGSESAGNLKYALERAKIILWEGHCHVHTAFTPYDVYNVRKRYPGVKIIVHPECTKEVVDIADDFGSTSFIVKYVEEAPKGAVIAIGTEINLVARLANKHRDKKIVELKRSLCPNMYKIDLAKLLGTLENLNDYEVVVPEKIKNDARKALRKMLEV
ncbi:MAG: quinolinate synthase NadA, partial [Rhodocyclaceae bacterium]|nr:quinolinate synthase NadA [Rhodocyclaceae bacterium]